MPRRYVQESEIANEDMALTAVQRGKTMPPAMQRVGPQLYGKITPVVFGVEKPSWCTTPHSACQLVYWRFFSNSTGIRADLHLVSCYASKQDQNALVYGAAGMG